MSNREVAGLNALAKKHGGELSVNPDTGLPEAGFLDSILPAVAGAGLTYLSGGAISPLMSAGIVGGLTALDSKDLSKGLMAGLGAYGGGEMVGGLAGLGAAGTAEYGPTLAGASQAVRDSAVDQAIANGTYQSAVGAGASNFANAPMSSLSALGGGSVLKGSLPILAGLAPAAADMLGGDEEGDGAPEQKKGYIRKYAFDPVTGQYKQVGVYEAGGDPNVDVSDKAGTAGAFGGVGQSEYEAAQGMASGGATSDSSRIYDYLMGRGPNPMQFTHTKSPQVDYTPYMPKPITPTTPILEQQYDEYGNPVGKNNRVLSGENGLTPEQRAEQAADNARPQAMLNGLSRDQYFGGLGLTREEQNAVRAQADKDNPKTAAAINFVKTLAAPVYTIGKAIFGEAPVPADPLYSAIVNADAEQREFARTGSPLYSGNTYFGDAKSAITGDGPVVNVSPPTGITEGFNYNGLDGGSNFSPTADAKGDATGGYGSAEAARDAAGRDPGGWNDSGNNDTGSNDNDNGGQFARGGISGHLRPPQPFYANGKFSYKGPQVYADGGIAALAQRYDDGGMTLPLKAQPINNLGSMHPKSLQAAYDHAVATNDVAGARKYQNELGLRSKLQNAKIYADGGETGEYNLGGYSDGGRLLKGPGDGVSDDIPATIGHGQPARLADGEFVVPARIVSELGNGSTDAGARELYKMMDRIQAGRAKTVGKDQVAKNSKAVRHLPA
jgi:hypothetical protein